MTTCVIFDMDGVLTDSEPIINAAAIAGLKDFGVDSRPEDFIPFVGTGEDRYIGGVAELYGRKFTPEMKKRVYEIYLDILPGMIKTFPGVIEMIHRLTAAGVIQAVASSADRIKVEANLRGIGLDLELFRVIVTGEDVRDKKPSPAIYLATASRLNILPENCCVVEDAINGVTAAKAAGMRCVAVEHSFASGQLAAAMPDRICRRFTDITFEDLGIRNTAV